MTPKIGMAYDDVARRVKRIRKSAQGDPEAKGNLIRSLKNQCRLSEGESAIIELERECAMTKEGSAFSGAGHKQIGWGSGHRLGDGHWRWENGSWIRTA